jgi:hypothetical protein
MHHAFDLLGYFARREWSFPNANVLHLHEQMSVVDRKTFRIDVRQVVWQSYMHDLYMGIRRYLLKEDDANIAQARKRMNRIIVAYFLFRVFLCLGLALLVYFSPIWTLFRWPLATTFSAVSWTATTLCEKYVLV